ncbi:serine/threonine-protein kinase PknD [Colletotrichum spaethianum]|uniref:Serine/threonine-protein kinase PknD n=1 Tax=Colletotrichum spaethianum TaxID=700344 RepID=A0AA37ULF2_9PEZI|nr:serine/threonine-protein kinase PknD [Colletotrichum spaethianum]GKT51646.1 serine/threonine-protein kinase PknD [Colletotrichum spaethianum]
MSLFDSLRDSQIKSPFGPKFLPLSCLDTAITKTSVEGEFSYFTRLLNPYLSQNVVQHARKVFAVLVFIDRAAAICELYNEGLTDDQLPLSRNNGDDRNVLFSDRGKKRFTSFRSWTSASVDLFLDKQWLFQSPVFGATGEHLNLDPTCALPMLPDAEEVAAGLYNVVYRGTLHPAHQKGLKCGEDGLQIALKEFRGEDRENNFNKERENLSHIEQHNHPHLIKHIATCQSGKSFFVIFPWADGGSLRDFWEHEDPGEPTPELVSWSLQQMLGLIGALKALHSFNCRHGDLKPENILHFKEGDDKLQRNGERGILVMADVGVSRVHKQTTRFRAGPTTTKATTISYQAPETETYPKGPRSRAYDAWSIGCIFLEHIVWLLYGLQGIESFETSRECRDLEGSYVNAKFYKAAAVGSQGSADIHPAVLKAMAALGEDPRCRSGTALGDLLKLIREKLLLIEPQARANAGELHGIVEKIVRDTERNPLYLLPGVNRPLQTPPIFQPTEPGKDVAFRVTGLDGTLVQLTNTLDATNNRLGERRHTRPTAC